MPSTKTNKVSFFSLPFDELEKKVIDLNLKKFNAKQIYQWVYQKHVLDFSKMTNIAKESLVILNENFKINNLKVKDILIDQKDETTKFLYELDDGNTIESVIMKFDYGYSVCISTQVGCNMGCKFCASGKLKKIRNLSADEIVLQVFQASKYLKEKSKNLTNVVVMGIGEPLDNFDNLEKALKIINNHNGLGIGSRHITVSTCGLVNKICEFGKKFPQINLAISLHAPNDEKRSKIMPINKAFNLSRLINELIKYQKITNRRVSFEYILFDQFNDSDQDAKELINLLKKIKSYVNLIKYNDTNNKLFQRSKRIKRFFEIINASNITCTIRLERGTNIIAACGQLRSNKL